MQGVSSRRGRPRNPAVYRGAQIAVAKAIVEMGRIGGNLPWMRAQKKARSSKTAARRNGKQPAARFSDDDLAELLPIGSNQRGIKKLADGSRAIRAETATSAVQKLIERGLLPRRALSPIALDNGHARAMKPFAPLMKQLLRVKIGSEPPQHLQRKVQRLAELHRAAIVDFGRIEKEERARFREASGQLRGALLALRNAELSDVAGADEDSYCDVAAAAVAVQEALDQLVVSQWRIRTPRYVGRKAIRQVLPPFSPSGVPLLGSVVSWIKARLPGKTEDFMAAVQLMQELVRRRWAKVPTYQAGRNDQPSEQIHTSAVACADAGRKPWDLDESLISSDPWLGPLYGRIGKAASQASNIGANPDDRFVRRVVRTTDAGNLGILLLFQMVGNWYFQDDEGDSLESDFEDRLRALRAWAEKRAYPGANVRVGRVPHADGRPVRAGENASMPSWSDMKSLLRDLGKIEVRPWVEMNMDVPDALPLDQQWWRAEAATPSASTPVVVRFGRAN
jgi:hypothetical protein